MHTFRRAQSRVCHSAKKGTGVRNVRVPSARTVVPVAIASYAFNLAPVPPVCSGTPRLPSSLLCDWSRVYPSPCVGDRPVTADSRNLVVHTFCAAAPSRCGSTKFGSLHKHGVHGSATANQPVSSAGLKHQRSWQHDIFFCIGI